MLQHVGFFLAAGGGKTVWSVTGSMMGNLVRIVLGAVGLVGGGKGLAHVAGESHGKAVALGLVLLIPAVFLADPNLIIDTAKGL